MTNVQEHTGALAAREQQVMRWLASRFGNYRGFICIGHIDGDPRYEDMRQDWFDNKKQREAAQHILMLESQGFNVYIGLVRHNARKRTYPTAQKSVWLWTDDAPADFEATEIIRSSEGSRQAWIRLESPLSADERHAWQKHIRRAIGGDATSGNAVHMARAPFGFNTKRHGKFAVHVEGGTGKTYTLTELEARYGKPSAAPQRRTTNGGAHLDGDIFNAKKIATYRKQLANPRTKLLKDAPESTVSYIERIPAHVYPGTQTHDLLTNAEKRRAWRNKGGSWDASQVRYIVQKGLICVGYDANLIAAFLLHLEDPETLQIKGEQAILDDIARMFAPEKLGTLYAQKQAEQRQRRARQDRPQRHTPDTYYMLLCEHQQDGSVPLKRKERAALAGVSTRTLDRLEDALEQQERITIHVPKDRSGSTVELLRGVVNILVASESVPTNDADEAADEVLTGKTDEAPESCISTPENADAGAMHKEHTAPLLPSGRGAPPLGRVVTMAQRTAWEAIHRDVLNEATGELTGPKLKDFRQLMADAGIDAPAEEIARLFAWATWELDRYHVRTLDNAALINIVAARQRALARNIGKPREGYHRTRLQIADDERRRRRLVMPERVKAPKQPRTTRPPAAPQARAGVSLFQESTPEQLTLAAAPQAPRYDGNALIARLRARQEAIAA